MIVGVLFLIPLFLFASGEPAFAKKTKKASRETASATAPAVSSETEKLFKAKCASCHGAAGEGSAKIAKMLKLEEAKLTLNSAATQKASDEDLLKTLLEGKEKMPSFKGKVTDDEAKKLIHYIRTFKK